MYQYISDIWCIYNICIHILLANICILHSNLEESKGDIVKS